MQFDPTIDYGNLDMKNDQNRVFWFYGEMIKMLYTLSGDAEFQREIVGIGHFAEEMAVDMDSYFVLVYENYLRYGLLNEAAVEKLHELDKVFIDESENSDSDFWNPQMLEINMRWIHIRKLAKSIIEMIGMQDLKLEYNMTSEKTKEGGIVQSSKSRLVRI